MTKIAYSLNGFLKRIAMSGDSVFLVVEENASIATTTNTRSRPGYC